MGTSLFNIGVSGLLTNQRILNTISHNIANVNTDGYSRQRTELVTRPSQLRNGSFVGSGVEASTVARVIDAFLENQLRVSGTSSSQASAFLQLTSQVNNLLANASTGLAPALQSFFDGVQEVADDPASIPARQVLVSEAESLITRFNSNQGRLSEMFQGVNITLTTIVDEINTLAQGIAKLNEDIVLAEGRSQGAPPNDLLDKRDLFLNRLSELVGTSTVLQDDGAINVTVGNGQVLVAGKIFQNLSVVNNPFDASRKEIAYVVGATQTLLSNNLRSGQLGGVLDFRDQVLEPARNSLGRVAVGLAQTFNAQNRDGMDLNGNLGGDFFVNPSPTAFSDPSNAGTISVAFNANDLGGLTTDDYQLAHDGTNFNLTNLTDGTVQVLAGAGPFNVDGVTISITSPPAAGDLYLIQPTKFVARDISLVSVDPKLIAAAAPIKTSSSFTNIGDGAISAGEVLDVTNPGLLTTTSLVFNNPPTTYQINGVGPLIPYTVGANIDVNGWRVQLSGAPAAGDQFTIESNVGGVSDNRNALLAAGLQSTDVLEGGTATLGNAYGQLIAEIGAKTQQAEISSEALSALFANATESRNAVSGVNLDEEAANLIRFQQAYQASAQIISTAQETFSSLLLIMRG